MEKSGGNLWVSGLGQAVTRILLFRLLDCLSDKNSFSFNVFFYKIIFLHSIQMYLFDISFCRSISILLYI